MSHFKNVLILFVGFSLLAGGPSLAHADEFNLTSLQSEVLATIKKVRPAVVRLTGRGSAFSGVIVSPEGHILSVAHAVTPGTQYRVTLPDGRRFRAIGKGSNDRADCALVMINDPGDELPHVPMGDSASLVPNQPCIGLSFPGGQTAGTEPIVRFGHIIRADRRRSMVQSSALMEPGDSGGPLFDLNGYVIGIHSRIGRSFDRNYEVPVNVYRGFWNELNREQTFARSGPPTPKLGIRCQVNRGWDNDNEGDETTAGVRITRVYDDTIASRIGIKVDDRIFEIYNRKVKDVPDLQQALVAARDEGAETIQVHVQRGEERLVLDADYDVEREPAPEVALPDEDYPQVVSPRSFNELSRLPAQLAELEGRLDDACVEIESGSDESIVGTRIKGTQWIISKSSVIGETPTIDVGGQSQVVEVVLRDSTNDLVLLKANEVHDVGIEIKDTVDGLAAGLFLLSPDEDGPGRVSVVSSPTFRSRKQYSRGYLGVVPVTYEEQKGALLTRVVDNGAAKRAGLQEGDVITKMNETVIRSQQDVRNFLTQLDPSVVIQATILRGEEELTKSIKLGSVPNTSQHAANQMDKSARRDGFDRVLSHDATLDPEDCGGPLFDIEGNFVGLNIARNSRVRSYALPVSILRDFVEKATGNVSDQSVE